MRLTRLFTLTLRSPGEYGMMPAFGAMKMLDSDGNQLAEINPELGTPGSPPQAVDLSLRSAPVGSRLLVQVAAF